MSADTLPAIGGTPLGVNKSRPMGSDHRLLMRENLGYNMELPPIWRNDHHIFSVLEAHSFTTSRSLCISLPAGFVINITATLDSNMCLVKSYADHRDYRVCLNMAPIELGDTRSLDWRPC
jgi:hypothetical protein